MKREGAEKQFLQKRENLVGGEGGWGRGEGMGNSFYQTLMDKDREGDGLATGGGSNGAKRMMEEGLEKQTGKSELEAGRREDSKREKEKSSLPAREFDMVIHVFDDQRKSKLATTKHTNHRYSGNRSRGKNMCCYQRCVLISLYLITVPQLQLRDSSTARELCW